MKYDDLIVGKRLRESENPKTDKLVREFDSDRGRVLFSAPLRRLQRKAQVFSLESNAAVRSRLTHSMEVAHIGRYIAQQLKWLIEDGDNEYGLLKHCEGIEKIVETACFLHDIGNPPFGHLGEKAIQKWFTTNASAMYKLAKEGDNIVDTSSCYQDFAKFDGNPQGLRIALTLQGKVDKKGLNLTLSQIASLIKYPKLSTDDNAKYKKVGVFTSESEDVKTVWKDLGLDWGVRHPLLFLMEAADDIAYSLSDIEDGIEKKIVKEKDVLDSLEVAFKRRSMDKFLTFIEKSRGKSDTYEQFVYFRTQVINTLTEYAAKRFYDNQDAILKGQFEGVFCKKEADEYYFAVKEIKKLCKEELYASSEAVDIEIAGYNVVYGILEKFSILLELNQDDFTKLVEKGEGQDLSRRMFSKLPESLTEHYCGMVKKQPENEWYWRVQLIIDFISGMTDDFALRVYKLLYGIQVEII